jgi:membrane protein YqaA with SNARE-associated domain
MTDFEVYTSLFISSFLSSTLLPGHSELTLTTFIFLKKYSIIELIIFASIGNILGSILNWCMGYYLTNLKNKKWFPINTLQLTRASSWFLKYGKWTLFFSWVPLIGDPLTIIAGVFRVPIYTFILIVSIAKIMRYFFVSLVATNIL